jgi:hypothetical protein
VVIRHSRSAIGSVVKIERAAVELEQQNSNSISSTVAAQQQKQLSSSAPVGKGSREVGILEVSIIGNQKMRKKGAAAGRTSGVPRMVGR